MLGAIASPNKKLQPTEETWRDAQQVLVFLEDNWAYYKNDAAHHAVVRAAAAELFHRPAFESIFDFMLVFLLAPKRERCSAAYPLLVSTLCRLIRGSDLERRRRQVPQVDHATRIRTRAKKKQRRKTYC